jgi:WD40 repeat protein
MNSQEPSRLPLDVFVSSPSDVKQERIIARGVLERLAREFYHFFEVRPVLWERKPLIATEHFQTMIIPPHETDMVVCILWSRLGVTLPEDQFRGVITGKRVTGTEWEFEDAVKSYRSRRVPDILVYRKRAPVFTSIDDPKQLEEAIVQKRLLDDFIQRWFVGDDQSLKVASHDFSTTTEFAEILEIHVRELISKRLAAQRTAPGAAVHSIGWAEGSPYRGLAPFEPEHAIIFFGRTRARNELREALVHNAASGKGFALVLGASGSGKSSLVKAGLIPDLAIPGMADRVGLLRWCLFRPSEAQDFIGGIASALFSETALPELRDVGQGPDTLAATFRDAPALAIPSIRAALVKVGRTAQLTTIGEPRLLVVIDQLEELFTLNGVDESTRGSVATVLSVLAHSGRVSQNESGEPSHGDLVWVVGTMRSDFYSRLSELPELLELADGTGQYHLPPPRPEELGQIIRGPAREAGLTFEVNAEGIGLDAVLLEAASHGTGALSLLEFTLDELFSRSAGDRLLTYDAYSALGGLQGSIGRRAEHVYQSLPTQVQDSLPVVFRSLVTVEAGDDVATATARTIPYDTIAATAARKTLVDALVQARLLVLDGGSGKRAFLRVAHEALLAYWPRVRDLIAADRQFLQARTRLLSAVDLWQREDRSPERLLPPGRPLAEAEDMLESRPDELESEIVAYIHESAGAARQKERRRFRVVAVAAIALAVLSVIAIAGGYVAFVQGQNARDQAALAMARQLAAESELTRQDPRALEESGLLALESLRRRGTIAAATALRKVLALLPRGKPAVVEAGEVRAIAISPDGRFLATGAKDGRASVWELGTNKEVRRVEHGNGVEVLSLHPNGRYLATGGRDGQAVLWEIETGIELYRYQTSPVKQQYITIGGPSGTRTESAEITALVFSYGGNYLAVAGADGIIQLVDVGTRKALFSQQLDSRISHVAFSQDDRMVAASSGRSVVLWDLTKGRQFGVIQLDGSTDDLQIDPKGRYVATALNRTATLWDVQSQKRVADFQHDQTVSQVRFQPDGRFLWSTSADRTIRQWDIETRHELHRVQSGDWVRILIISPDGNYIATADFGDVARIWNPSTGAELARLSHEAQISALAFVPGKDLLAVASNDGVVKVWRVGGGSAVAELAHRNDVEHLSFSSDGSVLVTVEGFLGSANIWHLPEGRRMGRYEYRDLGNDAKISPDGAHLIQTSRDWVSVREIDTGNVVQEIPLEGAELPQSGGYSIGDVTISGNGRWILKQINGVRRLWEITDGRAKLRKTLPGSIRLTAFSGDSTRLITVATTADAMKEQIEVHHLEGDQRLATWFSEERMPFFALSPDSQLIAMPGIAYTRGWTIEKGPTTFNLPSSSILIRYLNTGKSAAQVLIPNVAVPNRIEMMAFTPDGRFLAAGLADGTLSIVRVAGSEEVARVQHGAPITALGFSPDQQYLVTAGKDGFVRLWQWRIDDLVAEACSRMTRNFQYREWTKYFGLEPYGLTCKNLPPHPSVLEQARLLAEMGLVDQARVLLDRALHLGVALKEDRETWIGKATAVGLVNRSSDLAAQGRVEEALSALVESQRHNPAVEITAKVWNEVCWQGALREKPEAVIQACDRAVTVASEEEDGAIHDSRGVARARLGDYDGAIADFELFLAWAPQHERSEADITKRKEWIGKLKQKQNPFDPDTLRRLREVHN